MNKYKELPTGFFMQWLVASGSGDPVKYFKEKYGYAPTQFALADDVEIELPPSLSQSKIIIGKVQPGYILLR